MTGAKKTIERPSAKAAATAAKLAASNENDGRLSVRMPVGVVRAIAASAKLRGMTVAAFLREACRDACREAGAPIPEDGVMAPKAFRHP
jgi:hypothetical protein